MGFYFPELEHKLQASLQQYSENTNSGNRGRNEKSKVEIDPATGEPMDEEWDGASYAERSIANKNRRKRVEQSAISERIGKWFPIAKWDELFLVMIDRVIYPKSFQEMD